MLNEVVALLVLVVVIGAIAAASDISQRSGHGWIGSDIALLVFSAVIVLLLHVWAEASDHAVGAPAPNHVRGAPAVPIGGATGGSVAAS